MEKIVIVPHDKVVYPAVALIGAHVSGTPNFMTVSHCGSGGFKPPLICFPMNKLRYTLKGIRENRTFSVNIPSCALVVKTDFCGIYSGRKKDKSRIFEIFYGETQTAPLIKECPLNMECKLIHDLTLGSHILIVGEVIKTYVSADCMTDGEIDSQKIDPIIYIPRKKQYHRLGKIVGQAFGIGKESHDERTHDAVLNDCLSGR